MGSQDWLTLVFSLAVCFGAAAIGSAWTASSVKTWYAQLNKPAFTPPNWIFGPVWSVLYACMAVSAWLVWRNAGWSGAKKSFLLFFLQLIFNVAWSGLFFKLRSPGVAMIEIVFLLASVAATAFSFLHFSVTAFWLMVPYVAWVGFASWLNLQLWRLNPTVRMNRAQRLR
jgi:tryptophan-rich sensory protein